MRRDCISHTYPGDNHANLSRLLANLSWLILFEESQPVYPSHQLHGVHTGPPGEPRSPGAGRYRARVGTGPHGVAARAFIRVGEHQVGAAGARGHRRYRPAPGNRGSPGGPLQLMRGIKEAHGSGPVRTGGAHAPLSAWVRIKSVRPVPTFSKSQLANTV